MIVSFEGIDGSGKTTQIHLLKSALEKEGKVVHVFREPGTTETGEQLRSIVLGKKLDRLTELFLFLASRRQFVVEKLQHIPDNEIIIIDRYIDSTVAYQAFSRGIPLGIVNYLNKLVVERYEPTITFYLKINDAVAKKRRTNNDMIETTIDYSAVARGFDYVAKLKRTVTIDAEQSIETVHNDIYRAFYHVKGK